MGLHAAERGERRVSGCRRIRSARARVRGVRGWAQSGVGGPRLRAWRLVEEVADLGFGRIVALHHRSSTSKYCTNMHQVQEENRCLYF